MNRPRRCGGSSRGRKVRATTSPPSTPQRRWSSPRPPRISKRDSISLVKPSTPAERGRRWRRWSAALRWANHEVAKSTKKFLNSKYGLGISRELLYKQKDLGRDAQATQSQAGSMLRALRDSWLTLPSLYPFAKPNARRR